MYELVKVKNFVMDIDTEFTRKIDNVNAKIFRWVITLTIFSFNSLERANFLTNDDFLEFTGHVVKFPQLQEVKLGRRFGFFYEDF